VAAQRDRRERTAYVAQDWSLGYPRLVAWAAEGDEQSGGRPPIADEPRRLVAIRLDVGVLEKFREEAKRRSVADQTLIDEVLAKHVQKDVA